MHEQQLDRDSGDLLEAYIDNELSAPQTRDLEARLRREPELSQELELARRIRRELRSLPHHTCPPEIDVPRALTNEAMSAPPRAAVRQFPRWRAARPWLAAAAVMATVIALRPTQNPAPVEAQRPEIAADEYSAAEVARAEADVKRALAYLGQLSETASQRVQQDLAQPRWAKPLQRLLAHQNEDARD